MYGASGDAHLRSEVSGACRDLSFVLEALWRICRVYIYRHLRAELLQLARVVTRYVAVREVLGRVFFAPGPLTEGPAQCESEHGAEQRRARRDTRPARGHWARAAARGEGAAGA